MKKIEIEYWQTIFHSHLENAFAFFEDDEDDDGINTTPNNCLFEVNQAISVANKLIHEFRLSDVKGLLAIAYSTKGRILQYSNQFEEALICFDQSLSQHASQSAIQDEPEYLTELAGIHLSKSQILPMFEKYEEALSEAQMSLQLFEQLDEYHEDLSISHVRASINTHIGFLLDQLNRFEESMPFFDRAVHIHEYVAQHDPDFRPEVASAHVNKGDVLFSMDAQEEALEEYEKALSIYNQILHESYDADIHYDKASLCLELGFSFMEQHDFHIAEKFSTEAVFSFETLLQEEPCPELQEDLAKSYFCSGLISLGLNQFQNAITRLMQSQSILHHLIKSNGWNDLEPMMNDINQLLNEIQSTY